MGLVVTTQEDMPSVQELLKLEEDTPDIIRMGLKKVAEETVAGNTYDLNFLYIEVSNKTVGRGTVAGNVFSLIATPFITEADDEWRPLLVEYLEELGWFAAVEEKFEDYHVIKVYGMRSGMKQEEIFDIFIPFIEELQDTGMI
jgi:hypothetical protein